MTPTGSAERSDTSIGYGIEEEVFITDPRRPSLVSLYYLARLLWSDPPFWYIHSDSNFGRGKDAWQCLMGGVEISTAPKKSPAEAAEELRRRRTQLCASVPDALIVPLGHLIDTDAPTLTCGLHIHVGGLPSRRLKERAYANIARFLPLLILITANAPFAASSYFGPSYRVAKSYAVGGICGDRFYRFQDIIYSRRLGTLEVRVFDPTWSLERIRVLLECIDLLANPKWTKKVGAYPEPDPGGYLKLRRMAAQEGFLPELRPLYEQIADLMYRCKGWAPDVSLFSRPPALEVREIYQQAGLEGTYLELDRRYREECRDKAAQPYQGSRRRREGRGLVARTFKNAALGTVGILGYYLPRAPYKVGKAYLEWHGSIRGPGTA